MKFVKLSWKNVEDHCKCIADKINESKYKPDMLISLGRGGMVPTRIISDLISVKSVYIFGIRLYRGVNIRNSRPTIENFNVSVEKKNILLIDDIIDSGMSVDAVLTKLYESKPASVKTATLLCKKQVVRRPSYYSAECENDDWIIFPWEKSEFENESK